MDGGTVGLPNSENNGFLKVEIWTFLHKKKPADLISAGSFYFFDIRSCQLICISQPFYSWGLKTADRVSCRPLCQGRNKHQERNKWLSLPERLPRERAGSTREQLPEQARQPEHNRQSSRAHSNPWSPEREPRKPEPARHKQTENYSKLPGRQLRKLVAAWQNRPRLRPPQTAFEFA